MTARAILIAELLRGYNEAPTFPLPAQLQPFDGPDAIAWRVGRAFVMRRDGLGGSLYASLPEDGSEVVEIPWGEDASVRIAVNEWATAQRDS